MRMTLSKKFRFCLVVCLALVLGCSVALANPMVNIINKSGTDIVIYDTGVSKSGTILKDGQTLRHPLPAAASKRIWIANKRLSTIEAGGQPSPFNPQADGDKMFSFFEYTVTGSNYTVNLSYVDYFSFPLTLSFIADQNNVCVKNFEYGFKSFSQVVAALKQQGSPWNQLVVQGDNGIYRIYGPNLVWQTGFLNGINSLPPKLQTFYTIYPPNGKQLFPPHENNEVWQNYAQIPGFVKNVEPRLMTNGFAKALLSGAPIDKYKKHGFYITPKDAQAEFTNLQNSNTMTVTVYPYNDTILKKK